MTLVGHGDLVKLEVASDGTHWLAARANHFGKAEPVVIVTVGFIGCFALMSIVLTNQALSVVQRRSCVRLWVYNWVMFAALTFAMFNLVNIPRIVVWYNDNRPNAKFFATLTAVSQTLYWWTDALLFAAALFILRQRRDAVATIANGTNTLMSTVSMILDLLLLAALAALAFARSMLLLKAIQGRYDGDLRASEYAEKIETVLAMGYALVAIMFALVLDVGVSGFITRKKVSGPDPPTTTVLAAVFPMFIVHWMWRTAMTVYASLDWYGRISPSDKTEDLIALAVALEAGLLVGGIIIAFLIVGFKRDVWYSLVDRHPVYTGLAVVPNTYTHQPWTPQPQVYQTQQIYQYPQQQQQQQQHQQLQWDPKAGVAYAQAPAYAHQQVAPNLPQV